MSVIVFRKHITSHAYLIFVTTAATGGGILFVKPADFFLGPVLSHTPFADLTDVTLADEDTNSILADNAKREIQSNESDVD